MANEIRTQISQSLTNGNLTDSVSLAFNTDQATADAAGGSQTIGFAAHEAVVLGDVSSIGPSYFANLDATNFVELGIDDTGTFVPIIKIMPGEAALFQPASGVTLYAQADTAAVKIRRLIPSL